MLIFSTLELIPKHPGKFAIVGISAVVSAWSTAALAVVAGAAKGAVLPEKGGDVGSILPTAMGSPDPTESRRMSGWLPPAVALAFASLLLASTSLAQAELESSNPEFLLALAHRAPEEALEKMLPMLVAGEPPVHPSLRRAIRTAASSASGLRSIEQWLASSDIGDVGRLAVARSIAGLPNTDALCLRMVSTRPLSTFEHEWAALRVLQRLSFSPMVEARVRKTLSKTSEWPLRVLALEILAENERVVSDDQGRALAEDSHPRIRKAALHVMPKEALSTIARIAIRDRWPMVRAEAVRAIALRGGNDEVARRALFDPAARVRAAAIDALRHTTDPNVVRRVHQRLTSSTSRPRELEAAIAFARKRCDRSFVAALKRRASTEPNSPASRHPWIARQAWAALRALDRGKECTAQHGRVNLSPLQVSHEEK